MTNTNLATGVRFGVASLASLEDWVFEEFLNDGTNLSYEAALADFDGDPDDFEYEGDEDSYELELEKDGLKLGLSTLGGAYNVWVYESPHVAPHALCSPCCPNAGDINSVGGFDCYTLPDEWFRRESS